MNFIERYGDFCTVVSLALTVPFLCYCIEIAYLWWPSLKDSYKKEGGSAASGKLAKGIWIGFVSNFFDNVYWGLTWFALLFKLPIAAVLLAAGPFFNIFFRQMGGLIAAKHHVDAAGEMYSEGRKLHQLLYWLAGAVTGVVLWFNI